MVQKTVNAEVKADLKSSIIVQNLDIYCLRSYHPSNSTSTTSKVLTQGTTAKESYSKDSRPKKKKLTYKKAPVPTQTSEIFRLRQEKKNDKKRKFWEYKQDFIGEQKEQTLATSVNTTEADLKKKYLDIIYYNCDKKDHYSKSYPEPPKN